MRLPQLQSRILRQFLLNSLAEAGLVERDFAFILAPWISRPTVYRLLGDANPTMEQVDLLLHVGGRRLGFNSLRVRRFLDEPFHPEFLAEAELASAACFACDSAEVGSLASHIDRAVGASRRLVMFSSVLPSFMLDEEVIDRRLTCLARRSAKDPERVLASLRAAAYERRHEFMNFLGLAKLSEVVVVTTLSGLVRLRKGFPPFSGSPPEIIDECFDSVKHDSLMARDIRLVILNDLIDGAGRRWLWARNDYGTAAAFDCGLALKRLPGRLACRVLQADSDPLAANVFANRSHELNQAVELACHGTTKKATVQFLDDFLLASGRRPRLSVN